MDAEREAIRARCTRFLTQHPRAHLAPRDVFRELAEATPPDVLPDNYGEGAVVWFDTVAVGHARPPTIVAIVVLSVAFGTIPPTVPPMVVLTLDAAPPHGPPRSTLSLRAPPTSSLG